jgi:hypothetical protein
MSIEYDRGAQHAANATRPVDNAAQPDEDAELLPCPFCGGGNVTWHPRMNTTGCEDCNIYVSRFDKAEAIAAWNRRLARLAGGKQQVSLEREIELLEEIDDHLADIENRLKGDDGDMLTDARGWLQGVVGRLRGSILSGRGLPR